jgi:hypothetical protein
MATKKEKKVREIIDLDHDTLMDLWDNVNYKGDSHELNGETYTHVDKINTSDKSDGDSWEYKENQMGNILNLMFGMLVHIMDISLRISS